MKAIVRLSIILFINLICISTSYSQKTSLSDKVKAQLPNRLGEIYSKLPEDLDKEKLLFIKFTPYDLTDNVFKGISKSHYEKLQHHNEIYTKSNEQLFEQAKKYPFKYRITTQDSILYFRNHGYKYMLFHDSFNALGDGWTVRRGYIFLHIRDLTNNDKYFVDEFSSTFIYYYKGQVDLLLKKVSKRFKIKIS